MVYWLRLRSPYGLMAASNNVIPAKAGIQKLLKSLDSRLRGSDKLVIIRGSLMSEGEGKDFRTIDVTH